MIYFALSVWYIFVATAPNLISEYLPPEAPADVTTILGSFIIALLWVPIIYFTWKQKKVALITSIVYSLFLFVTVLIGFLFKSLSAPAFSDFLFFPDSVLIIAFSAMAYRSLSKRVS